MATKFPITYLIRRSITVIAYLYNPLNNDRIYKLKSKDAKVGVYNKKSIYYRYGLDKYTR